MNCVPRCNRESRRVAVCGFCAVSGPFLVSATGFAAKTTLSNALGFMSFSSGRPEG